MYIRLTIAHQLTIIAVLLLCPIVGLSQTPTVTSTLFGTTSGGTDVMQYTLTNSNGLEAKVIEYGGTLISLEVPDRNGTLANIVRGYDNLNSYVQNPWTGSIIGRYANRIANARFTLDGVEYILTANSGSHQLHGGMGVDLDNDLHFYFERAKAMELKFGASPFHLKALEAALEM